MWRLADLLGLSSVPGPCCRSLCGRPRDLVGRKEEGGIAGKILFYLFVRGTYNVIVRAAHISFVQLLTKAI